MVSLKNVNMKALQTYKHKLKELKTWAQVKSPKSLQPALSYTLGWLSPELLGTDFRMVEISDFAIKGIIPADTMNLDALQEVNQGVVLNASLELARVFINRHLPENFYKVISSEVKIVKRQKWTDELQLHLSSTESALDHFFSELQKSKKTEIQFSLKVENGKSKKFDTVEIKLVCESTHLLES